MCHLDFFSQNIDNYYYAFNYVKPLPLSVKESNEEDFGKFALICLISLLTVLKLRIETVQCIS